VWATLVPIALATGYFRIAADRHWTTDVVTGWFTGAAIGFVVPYFFHRRHGAPVTPAVAHTSTSTTVGVALTW
jgi:membrane-associated phospholipid phosphatase